LQIADSLRASGAPELAEKYYQRARDEYPHTAAGKDAAWELDRDADPAAP
jgi:TolA-binding protein